MTKTKHTPAPWVLKPDPDADNRWDMVVVSDHRYIQCEGRTYEEAQANAQLIVAAPELLEALKLVMKHAIYDYETNDDIINAAAIANAAIAKAEGR